MTVAVIRRELRGLADPKKALFVKGYFKTGPGEYGEGDKFLGVAVPELRKLARAHRAASLTDLRSLLRSAWHEERALALLILSDRYRRAGDDEREKIFDLYLSHTAYINNWDLVDCAAEHVVGAHLDAADLKLLKKLARSDSLWERRIAILATRCWIKAGIYEPTLKIAGILLEDSHDLIHKAVGWMLREIGDKDRTVEEAFLRKHGKTMPRTMLRYAIEKFPRDLRQQYLRGAY